MAAQNENYGLVMLKRIHESEYPSEHIFLTAEKDNQRFPIHTIVLAAASKYFTASLGSNFQEAKKSEFVLEGTDGATVEAIVDYCYTGEIDLTGENVVKFLEIASSVQLDLLEAKCRRFYEEKLSSANCVEALMVADRYGYADIRQRTFKMVRGLFEELPTAEIQKLDYRLVQELLKCDHIVATEEFIFKRLLEWFQFNETDRTSHMPELLKSIRLDLLSGQFMYDTLEVIYEKFNCPKLVVAEYRRRALTQRTNISGRRLGFNFCLFTQFKGEDGATVSAVKIEKVNPILNSFEHAGEIALGDRVYSGVVMLKNKIYVLGGRLNRGLRGYLKSVSAFDLESGVEETLPPMNFSRGCFTPISHGKYIYAFGGCSSSNPIKSCERFDTETKTWTVIKSMNVARDRYSVTEMNGYICVAGGDSNSVEFYDPNEDRWTLKASMHTNRRAFALIKSNEFTYAMGDAGDIERYDHRQNSWENVGSFKDCELVTSTINISGNHFVIMRNGEFGQITISESGALSFVRLGKSKYESINRRRHFLC